MADLNGSASVMSPVDISLNFDDLDTQKLDSEEDLDIEDGAPNLADLIVSSGKQENSESDTEFGVEISENLLTNDAPQIHSAGEPQMDIKISNTNSENEAFNINITDSLDLVPDDVSSQSDSEIDDGQPFQQKGPVINLNSGARNDEHNFQQTGPSINLESDVLSHQRELIIQTESDKSEDRVTSQSSEPTVSVQTHFSTDGQSSPQKQVISPGITFNDDSILENSPHTEQISNDSELKITEKQKDIVDFHDDNTEVKITKLSSDDDGGFDAEFEVPDIAKNSQDPTLNNSLDVKNVNVAASTDSQSATGEQLGGKDVAPSDSIGQPQGDSTVIDDDRNTANTPSAVKNTENTQSFNTDNAVLQRLKASGLIDDTRKNVSEDTQAARGENEWDAVQTIEAGPKDSDPKHRTKGASNGEVISTPPILYIEVVEKLAFQDYTSVKPSIKPENEKRGLAFIKSFLFGPPKLARNLIKERDLIFCVAASALENGNDIHIRTLQSIYRALTGSKFDCRRFGNHWEEIGFQGNDPATDLRAVGVLGLVQLLYFLTDRKKKTIAQDIYKLSLHPTQNFPFCVMSINMTRIALQSLREGSLNRDSNRVGSVFPIVNDFYIGIYLHLFQLWKSQGKTIADSGFVIKEVEKFAKKGSRVVLRSIDEHLDKKKNAIAVDTEGELSFFDVCDTKDGKG